MAIAFDAASNNYTGSNAGAYTVSQTCSGSHGLLLCLAAGSTVAITGITYNSVSMTFAGSVTGTSTNTIYAYYLLGPSTGTNSAIFSFSGGTSDIQAFCASYNGVSQSGFPDKSSFPAQLSNPPITLTLNPVASNAWMFSAARNNSIGPMTASTGVGADRSSGTRYFSAGDSNGALTAGSQSQTWTGGSGVTIGLAMSFAPFAAATANANFLQFM